MRKLQIKKLSSAAVLTIAIVGIAFVGVLANVKPASAAAGNVNLQFGNWHCPYGGSIVYINGVNVTPTGYGTGYVGGSRASVFVWFNTVNTAYATVTCKYHPSSMWYCPWCTVNMPVSIYGVNFWPSFVGQTIYL